MVDPHAVRPGRSGHGTLAGRLAATFGYGRILRLGLIGAVAGVLLMILTVDSQSRPMLLLTSVLVGIAYAGVANIVLNGLGIVLSPRRTRASCPVSTRGRSTSAPVSASRCCTRSRPRPCRTTPRRPPTTPPP
ncbi:hypothetical protein SHKM778_35630 [Streptomyces sp. KM77-8]|uniref:Uncharacterized protein n=1 Tax=Streptomyces haneummycinicus TaxID=3074435 RepID=A0AAT9HII2_9ACTN